MTAVGRLCWRFAGSLAVAALASLPPGGTACGEPASCLTTDTGQFTVTANERPAWEQPIGGIRLENRDVLADPSLPLPPIGGGMYVFARQPVTQDDLALLGAGGLRYLGLLGQLTYAFVREDIADQGELGDRDAAARSALIRCAANVTGAAIAMPHDRVCPDVLQLLHSDEAGTASIYVCFWPFATGGEVSALLGGNAASMRLPLQRDEMIEYERTTALDASPARLRELASSPLVSRIGLRSAHPLRNAETRTLSKVNEASTTYSLDGTGVLVALWDGGRADTSHQDLGGSRITNATAAAVHQHTTHVAGTILGTGTGDVQAKGMAPGANLRVYAVGANVMTERRDQRNLYYYDFDSESWGNDVGAKGSYDIESQTFDDDCRDLLLYTAKAGGNAGPTVDSLDANSTSKNILVVGATNGTGTIFSSSSRGPTDDGRVKPDICTKGQNVWSTYQNAPFYRTDSGTSMATPAIAGMLALLQQHHKALYSSSRMAPDVARAVMLHTTAEAGNAGPDYIYGWGIADVKAAADLLTADAAAPGTRLVRGSLKNGETKDYTMTVPGGATDIRVTLTWLDLTAGSTAAKRLVHDLDLELIGPNNGTTYYPYSLNPLSPSTAATATAANTRDNIEQVRLTGGSVVAGDWTVRVKGTNVSDASFTTQGFVLAASHALDHAVEVLRDVQSFTATGRAIPNDGTTALTMTFNATSAGTVGDVRVYVEILHGARGDLRLELISPDNTTEIIEQSDTNTRKDLCAFYPDTRGHNSDLRVFRGKTIAGMWTLRVTDTNSAGAGFSGTVRAAALEIEPDAGGSAPPVLTTITVTPDPITVGPGGTQQFTAIGRDQFGAVMTISPAPTWTINNATGGSVNASGLLTAGVVNGTYTVTATSGAVQGSADVTISSTPVLTTITVTPNPTTAIANGGTRQMNAVGRDQFGAVIAFTPTWTASGGTIDANGLFTAGAAAGPFMVTATDTATSVQGTATVTVAAQPSTNTSTETSGGGCAIAPYANGLLGVLLVLLGAFVSGRAMRRWSRQSSSR